MPKYYAVPVEPINTIEAHTPTKRFLLFWETPIGKTVIRQKALSGMDLKKHFQEHPEVAIYSNHEDAYSEARSAATYTQESRCTQRVLSSAKPIYHVQIPMHDIADGAIINTQTAQAKLLIGILTRPETKLDEPIAAYIHSDKTTSKFVFEPNHDDSGFTFSS